MSRKLVRIEGFVWCDWYGEVHTDELDPYDYGPEVPELYGQDQLCKPEYHRPVYYRERKGDWRDDGSIVE